MKLPGANGWEHCASGFFFLTLKIYGRRLNENGYNRDKELREEVFIMAVLHITNNNFDTEVLQAEQLVLLDFWASWCGPCQMLAPAVEQIAQEMPEIKVGKVNVDEQPELAQSFQIMSIPTLVLMKNGKVADKSIGLVSKGEIMDMVKKEL